MKRELKVDRKFRLVHEVMHIESHEERIERKDEGVEVISPSELESHEERIESYVRSFKPEVVKENLMKRELKARGTTIYLSPSLARNLMKRELKGSLRRDEYSRTRLRIS